MATRAELATLTNLQTYIDKLKMCVAFYAQYVIGESEATQNHDRRSSWGRVAVLAPVQTAVQIAALVALDPTFADKTSPVADWNTVMATMPETGAGSMQAAAEAAINNTILRF